MAQLKTALSRLSELHVHMLIQSSGTIVSQLIPIAVSPLLTRLFSPEDFGLYGVVVSIATLLAIFITLRIDHGIVVSPSDEEARKTAVLSLGLAILGAAVFALLAAATLAVLRMFDGELVLVWVVFGPLAGLLAAVGRTFTLFGNRIQVFKNVSEARIWQAASTAAVSVALGYLVAGSYGLVVGLLIGNFLYVAVLGRWLWPLAAVDLETCRAIVRSNAKFITFSLPADIVNSLSSRMPFIIFPALFGLEQTGYLALAYRVIATPARFVGSAISEVFYSHAAREYEQTGSCWRSARNVALILAGLGIPGFLVLYLVAEPLFVLVFGEAWRPAATFTRILTPMLFIAFVVSPLSVVFYIATRQKEDFLWQIAFLAATAASAFAGLWAGGILVSLAAMSAVGSVLYILYFLLIRRYAIGRAQARS